MDYAVIRVGGKQFMVEKGDKIEVERQEKPLKVETLYYTDGKKTMVGTPILADVKVKAELVEDYLGKKIRVARFKAKSRYRRVKGHRQPMSTIEIKDITVVDKKTAEKTTAKDEEKKSEPKSVKKTEKKAPKKEVKSKK